jgi:rod shape determining protein RodA
LSEVLNRLYFMIKKVLKIDWVLMLSSFLLLGIGMAVLYSISMATPNNGGLSIFWRQAIFISIGLVAMLFFAFSDYQILKSKSTLIYFLSLLILIFVLFFGSTVRGTVGWIGFGLFNVQPVEIAKLALIIFLASFISQKKMELGETGRLITSFILCSVMILLVIKQPDFGSAMVLVGIWLGMTVISGISIKKIVFIIIIGIGIAVFGWFINSKVIDPQGSGYNVNQSIIAVGSGGLIGKGIGHGSQSQLNFLPEKHTDFIFASIAEELGLLGSVFVIGLYFIIFYRIRLIALNSSDNFDFLMASGIIIMFSIQVLENIGMNIGIMPVTGIPLPLLSYGGSSLITVMAAIGILSNINSRKELFVQSED